MIHITDGAKEKGQELINLFLPLVNDNFIATECAIQCANQLLKMYIGNGFTLGKYEEYPSFWEQVKFYLQERI